MKMKIIVTQAHIDQGIPKSPKQCPVALAIDKPNATVGPECIGWGDYTHDWEFHFLPPEVRTFIKDFDDGLAVKPFEFEI